MTIENDTTGGTAGAGGEAPPAAAPPAAGTANAGAAGGAAPPAPPARRIAPLPDDIDSVKDDEKFEVSGRSFRDRIDRGLQARLKKELGVESTDEIKAKLDKLAAAEAKEEEARRAQMSEIEKLREDVAAAQRTAAEATQKLERTQTRAEQEKEVTRLMGLASAYIDPTMRAYALQEFIGSMKTKTTKEVDAMTDVDIKKYFRDLAKQKPKFAKTDGPTGAAGAAGATGATGATGAAKPPKVGATTGARAGAKPGQAPPPGSAQVKTAKPGKPNSIQAAELRKKYPNVPWRD